MIFGYIQIAMHFMSRVMYMITYILLQRFSFIHPVLFPFIKHEI